MIVKELFLLLLASLVLVQLTEADVDPDKKEKVEKGLGAMSDIAGILKDSTAETSLKAFTGILKSVSLAAKALPFLQAVGPIADLISLFLPNQEDAFQKEVKAEFEKVNQKLDLVLDGLKDVEKKVKLYAYKPDFEKYARRISQFKNKLVELSESNSPKEKKKEICKEFDEYYSDSGENLKGMLINDHGESIIDLYNDYTKKDRRLVLQFMKQAMRYVIAASEVEIAYKTLSGSSETHINDEIKLWQKNIKSVQDKMKRVDASFRSSDAYNDVNDYIRANSRRMSSGTLTSKIRDFLVKKYYWNKWLVISFKKGGYTYRGVCCGKSFSFKQSGHDRTIFVRYLNENRSFNRWAAQTALTNYKKTRDYSDYKRVRCGWRCRRTKDPVCDNNKRPMDTVRNEISSRVKGEGYTFVMRECHDLHARASSGSLATSFWIHRCWVKDCEKWHAIVFG